MATNHEMRQGLYEGILVIFFAAAEAMEVGDIVKLGTTGTVALSEGGVSDAHFGVCAQEVTLTGVPDYYPGGLVSHTAKVGDKIGVYIAGGILSAKGATVDPAYGEALYVDANGKLTATPGAAGDLVGYCVEAPATQGGVFKFKSLL